jgi:hypothetical protein
MRILCLVRYARRRIPGATGPEHPGNVRDAHADVVVGRMLGAWYPPFMKAPRIQWTEGPKR